MDLLRIVSMYMIVLLHSGSHGGTLAIEEGVSFYTILFHFIEALTICSVNVFVLISGYFLCTQAFRPSRIIKTVIAVVFYSMIWILVSAIMLKDPISLKDIIRALLPISYKQYWFISAYVGMYLLSPLLNAFLKNITQVQHIAFIIILMAVFSLWPDVVIGSNPLGIVGRGHTIIWFMVLYVVASFFRLYPIKIDPKITLGLYFFTAILLVLIWLLIALFTKANSFENEVQGMMTFYYFRYNSLLVFISAISLFLTFLDLKIMNVQIQKFIKIIAPLTLGVYLIHDNVIARGIVWDGMRYLEPTPITPLYVLGYTISIFVLCLIIDKIRLLLFSVINKNSWYISKIQAIDRLPNRTKIYIQNYL